MAFTSVQIGPNTFGTGSAALTLTAGSTAGNLLVACVINTSGAAFAGPAGWTFVAAAAQGSVSRASIWYYPNCPAGVTAATFTSSGSCRGCMAEFSTAAGTTQGIDRVGTANGGTGVTSFGVTAAGSSAAGDLGVSLTGDAFSAATTGLGWTVPSGYTVLRSQANATTAYSASYKVGLASGTQTVTPTYPSSANQTGWAGVFAAFNETAASTLSVATSSLPDGKVGITYGGGSGSGPGGVTLQATGGTPPCTWAVTVGTLPAGLSLAASGGRGGLSGVTAYMTGVTPDNAITNWETATGITATARKVYFPDATGNKFPTIPGLDVQSCLDLNLTCYLCYKPAYNPPTTHDYNALQASLQAFHDLGLKAKVILYQEVENQAPSAAQYKALLTFYEPAVHAVYPGGLVHDSSGSWPGRWASYFPGSLGLCDEYGVDFYGIAYANGTRIDSIVALTAATGKRFGVYEMGTSIGASAVPSDATITAYLQYLNGVAAANPPSAYLWYQQDNKNIHNVISDPSDFRVPLLQQIDATIAGATAGGGVIAGTPTGAGTSAFTVRVTDNNAATATAALSIVITGASAPVITTLALPAATVGVAYSQPVAVTGGQAPLTFTITAGTLPAGLALDPGAGVITGTPAATAATSGFTVTVTDANSQAGSQALFITVVASLPPPSPVPAVAGFPQIIIEAGLFPAAPQVPPGTFLLDDPVYGQLSEGNQLGDSTTWTDIAAFFRSGTISRTSTRAQGPLITYQAGAASAVLKNDGRFDPANPSSPYAGNLRPMLPLRVRAVYGSVAYSLWSGFTDSWGTPGTNWGPNYSETTVTGTDGFKVLAGITIPAVPLGSDGVGDGDGEDSGARVTRLLNAAGWYTDHRRVDVGDSTVQGTLFGDTALNLLQLTADSEIGSLYIDGGGFLVYRHRQAILLDTRSTQVQAIFGDLPGAVHDNGRVCAGAYLDTTAMGQPDQPSAETAWASILSRPVTARHIYFAVSQSSFTFNADMQADAAAGRKLIFAFKPSYNPVNAAELAAISGFLAACKAGGVQADVTIWHEPFFSGLTSVQYIAAVNYYGPVIRQYYPLVFVTSASSAQSNSENTWYPGDSAVDKVATDIYAGSYYTFGTRLDTAAQVADNAVPPKPFGIWEYNSNPTANFLAGQNAGFEGGIGNWTGSGNCTTTGTSAQAHSGSSSMQMSSGAAGDMTAAHCSVANILTQGLRCSPGDQIVMSAWLRAGASARTCKAGIQFYDSAGVIVGSALYGTGVTNSTANFNTQATATITAPANSFACRESLQVLATGGAAEVHFADDPVLYNATTLEFYTYIQSYFTGRKAAGKLNADLLFFNNTGGGGLSTVITSAADYRVPALQAIFDALDTSAAPVLTELPYTSLERADDDTQLANLIEATSVGGKEQDAQDAVSQRTYLFPRSYARSDLILEDDPTTLNWAQWVLAVSLEGDDRFDVLTVTPLRDPRLWAQVLGREIGDRIQVWRRPPGVAPIVKDVFVRGITHTVDVSTRTWSTVWDLQSAARYTGFLILDDTANGLLNTGKLAF